MLEFIIKAAFEEAMMQQCANYEKGDRGAKQILRTTVSIILSGGCKPVPGGGEGAGMVGASCRWGIAEVLAERLLYVAGELVCRVDLCA